MWTCRYADITGNVDKNKNAALFKVASCNTDLHILNCIAFNGKDMSAGVFINGQARSFGIGIFPGTEMSQVRVAIPHRLFDFCLHDCSFPSSFIPAVVSPPHPQV